MLLDELRNLNLERIDFDEAVFAHTFGAIALEGYKACATEPPDWLGDKVAALGKEVAARRRDNIERALKAARARLETLKTADEKRRDTAAEIERLTALLG